MALREWFGRSAAIAAGASLLLAGYFYYRSVELRELEAADLRFLREEIPRLDAKLGDLTRFRSALIELLSRKQIIEALSPDRMQAVLLLNAVVAQRPKDVRLERLALQGARAEIAGSAPSEDTVRDYMAGVSSSPGMVSSENLTVRAAPNAGVDFTFNATVRPRGGR